MQFSPKRTIRIDVFKSFVFGSTTFAMQGSTLHRIGATLLTRVVVVVVVLILVSLIDDHLCWRLCCDELTDTQRAAPLQLPKIFRFIHLSQYQTVVQCLSTVIKVYSTSFNKPDSVQTTPTPLCRNGLIGLL